MFGHVANTCRYCHAIREWVKLWVLKFTVKLKVIKNTVNYNICVCGQVL